LAWLKKLETKIATLRKSPLRCPVDVYAPEFGADVRVLLHGKPGGQYKILFLVIDDEVRIVAVRHAARGESDHDV